MTLQEIFDSLAYGEFSQLSIGGEPAGEINEANYGAVINHINLGLTALYKRFNLKEGRVKLEMQPGKLAYAINSKFAVANARSRETVKYLLDSSGDLFQDDIIKIEKVLTQSRFELPLNDDSSYWSVFTPAATMLRVPEELANQSSNLPTQLLGEILEIVYRANHPKIVLGIGFFDPARVIVQLPESHLEALLYFVASRVNNPIGMSNEFHAGNSYYAKFEGCCQGLEGAGLQVDKGSQNTRLSAGGWA